MHPGIPGEAVTRSPQRRQEGAGPFLFDRQAGAPGCGDAAGPGIWHRGPGGPPLRPADASGDRDLCPGRDRPDQPYDPCMAERFC